MARKTVSRKQLRAESEAAEKAESKKKKKKAAKKKGAKKKKSTRKKKKAEDVRMKLYWGVFNQSMKRVALYEFNQRKAAEKKAEDLCKGGSKTPHFVQRVKEPIEDDE